MATTQEGMNELSSEFYKNLIGTPQARPATLNLEALDLPAIDLADLEVDFTEDEIWSAIKELPADKSPGPDGFSLRFYRSCWGIIKQDFMLAINQLNRRDCRSFQSLNSAFITLLPKIGRASCRERVYVLV